MTISVTNIGTNANNSGATLAVAVPAGGVSSGVLIYVGVFESQSSANGTLSDTTNTYANDKTQASSGAGSLGSFHAFNVNALTSANSITYTKFVSGRAALMTACYATGILNSSDPIDSAVTVGGSFASTVPSLTSGTPANSGDLFFGLVGGANVGGITQDTSDAAWATPPNNVFQLTRGVGGGSVVNSGSGTLTYAPTLNNPSTAQEIIVAFSAAASTVVSFTYFNLVEDGSSLVSNSYNLTMVSY